MTKELRQRILNNFMVPFLAILSGLLVAALLILFTDTPIFKAYGILFRVGFGCKELTRCALLTTLERATPVILTGLSAVVAFRSGMFSIGQEGQMMMGAIFAAWLGVSLDLPPIIHPVVVMIIAMVAGGVYGYIPGVLRIKLGVNEIISTIVMNEIAIQLIEHAVQFPLSANRAQVARSVTIDDTAKLLTFVQGSKWGVAFVIAIAAAILVYVYLWHSSPGYEQRLSGLSSTFARFGGIRSDRAAIRAMIISGMLAGLAGALEVLGVHHLITTGYSSGLGFDGLSVAILGQVHPLGVVIVAILLTGISLGAQLGLQLQAQIPRELGGTIVALMILFVAAERFYLDNIDAIRVRVAQFRGRDVKREKT